MPFQRTSSGRASFCRARYSRRGCLHLFFDKIVKMSSGGFRSSPKVTGLRVRPSAPPLHSPGKLEEGVEGADDPSF